VAKLYIKGVGDGTVKWDDDKFL